MRRVLVTCLAVAGLLACVDAAYAQRSFSRRQQGELFALFQQQAARNRTRQNTLARQFQQQARQQVLQLDRRQQLLERDLFDVLEGGDGTPRALPYRRVTASTSFGNAYYGGNRYGTLGPAPYYDYGFIRSRNVTAGIGVGIGTGNIGLGLDPTNAFISGF